ncbi:MAG: HAMP domain-containing histidine kinase [Candidatus Eremiobacteraeota bacterium]|nr:HAMP domain-containing histidine kinase [Candidatus Eremiobacteraeota bacterium]
MNRQFFASMRWRITVWYGGALMLILIGFAFAVDLGVQHVLLSSAAARVASVGAQIDEYANAVGHGPFGPVSLMTRFAEADAVDHFAGPGLFVELYNVRGYVIAKSSNLGSADVPRSGYRLWRPPRSFGAGDANWGQADIGSAPVLAHWQVLRQDGVALATVYVADSLASVEETREAFSAFLVVTLLLAMAFIAAATAWLARTAIGPINDIARAVGEIGDGDLGKRLNWKDRRDELGTLAAHFDEMMGRLESAFARERRFIADASHELKTPLTVINANAQMLSRWAGRDEALRAEALEAIRSESATMAAVINAMLTLAKAEGGAPLAMEPVRLRPIVEEVAASLRRAAQGKGLTLQTECSDDPVVLGDAGLLRQLVVNLSENAVKFTSSGGVTIGLRCDNGVARLEVRDTGPGIAADALGHVFDRFYRADPARSRLVEGTGLGLAVVRSIVKVHGGTVRALSDGVSGATFVVELKAR